MLFCLFAEDIGLLPAGLFSRLLERTRTRPGAFAQQLGQLFGAMASGGWFGADEIVHFDGRLFDDAAALELDGDALAVLARLLALNLERAAGQDTMVPSTDPDHLDNER